MIIKVVACLLPLYTIAVYGRRQDGEDRYTEFSGDFHGVPGASGTDNFNECHRFPVCVQDGQVRAASPAVGGRQVLFHCHGTCSAQQVVPMRVHFLAGPDDLLGRIVLVSLVNWEVVLGILSDSASDAPVQLAFEVVEEVAFPLLVLFRRY